MQNILNKKIITALIIVLALLIITLTQIPNFTNNNEITSNEDTKVFYNEDDTYKYVLTHTKTEENIKLDDIYLDSQPVDVEVKHEISYNAKVGQLFNEDMDYIEELGIKNFNFFLKTDYKEGLTRTYASSMILPANQILRVKVEQNIIRQDIFKLEIYEKKTCFFFAKCGYDKKILEEKTITLSDYETPSSTIY